MRSIRLEFGGRKITKPFNMPSLHDVDFGTLKSLSLVNVEFTTQEEANSLLHLLRHNLKVTITHGIYTEETFQSLGQPSDVQSLEFFGLQIIFEAPMRQWPRSYQPRIHIMDTPENRMRAADQEPQIEES